jgi:hypothetical protein
MSQHHNCVNCDVASLVLLSAHHVSKPLPQQRHSNQPSEPHPAPLPKHGHIPRRHFACTHTHAFTRHPAAALHPNLTHVLPSSVCSASCPLRTFAKVKPSHPHHTAAQEAYGWPRQLQFTQHPYSHNPMHDPACTHTHAAPYLLLGCKPSWHYSSTLTPAHLPDMPKWGDLYDTPPANQHPACACWPTHRCSP